MPTAIAFFKPNYPYRAFARFLPPSLTRISFCSSPHPISVRSPASAAPFLFLSLYLCWSSSLSLSIFTWKHFDTLTIRSLRSGSSLNMYVYYACVFARFPFLARPGYCDRRTSIRRGDSVHLVPSCDVWMVMWYVNCLVNGLVNGLVICEWQCLTQTLSELWQRWWFCVNASSRSCSCQITEKSYWKLSFNRVLWSRFHSVQEKCPLI